LKAVGWAGIIGLAAVTVLFATGYAALLILLPLALMLVALPPRRPGLIIVGLLGATFLLRGPADVLTDFARGWALILGAWFLIAVIVLRRGRFLSRGLLALFGAAGTIAGIAALWPAPFIELDTRIRLRLTTGIEPYITAASGREGGELLVEAIRQGAEVQALLFPALIAIASLSGLAVAWWAYRRLAVQDREALNPLADFRFSDGLVWVLIVGLLLVLLPVGGMAVRAGSNLLAFMGTLYALRGVAVLLVLAGMPGPFGLALAIVIGVLLYPMVMAATFIIGLTDTWLDIRRRRAAVKPPGN